VPPLLLTGNPEFQATVFGNDHFLIRFNGTAFRGGCPVLTPEEDSSLGIKGFFYHCGIAHDFLGTGVGRPLMSADYLGDNLDGDEDDKTAYQDKGGDGADEKQFY